MQQDLPVGVAQGLGQADLAALRGDETRQRDEQRARADDARISAGSDADMTRFCRSPRSARSWRAGPPAPPCRATRYGSSTSSTRSMTRAGVGAGIDQDGDVRHGPGRPKQLLGVALSARTGRRTLRLRRKIALRRGWRTCTRGSRRCPTTFTLPPFLAHAQRDHVAHPGARVVRVLHVQQCLAPALGRQVAARLDQQIVHARAAVVGDADERATGCCSCRRRVRCRRPSRRPSTARTPGTRATAAISPCGAETTPT